MRLGTLSFTAGIVFSATLFLSGCKSSTPASAPAASTDRERQSGCGGTSRDSLSGGFSGYGTSTWDGFERRSSHGSYGTRGSPGCDADSPLRLRRLRSRLRLMQALQW